MGALSRYELGRALAAEEDVSLDHHGTPEAEAARRRVREIWADIERAGGWNDDCARGYFQARREYAAERLGSRP